VVEADDGPLRVGQLGDAAVLPVDHERVRLRAAPREEWRSVDCALLVGAEGLDALARAGELPVPTLVYDPDDDPVVAARASRLAVDEYVPAATLADRALADRLLAVATDGRDDRRREQAALQALEAVATDGNLGVKIDRLLRVGRERLGTDAGVLTRIDGDALAIEAESGDHPSLGDGETAPRWATLCRRTLDRDDPAAYHDVEAAVPDEDPTSDQWAFGCYLGRTVHVDGNPYGTLWFASGAARPAFAAGERTFVELLATLVGYEIERDRRERSLRRYRAVHETVEGMVFVVGREARLELATQPLADRFGYDRADLLGRPLTDLLGDDVVEKGYEALDELQSGAESASIEVAAETAAGETVPIAVELTLLSHASEFEGLVGVVYDRSELTETRAELATQRDRFRNLFDRVPDAVVDVEFVDGDPVVRAVNPAFEDTFGAVAGDVVGHSLAAVLEPTGEGTNGTEFRRDAWDAPGSITQLERETPDGRRTFLFRGFRYQGEGTERAFGIHTDVTDQLEQERRLRVLHRVLRHNLRNEMNTIIGYADLVAAQDPDRADGGYAEKISDTAADVAELSDQVQWIEQALDRERDPTRIDPAAVVADRVAESRRHPDATVRVDDAEAVPVVADGLLELAVENVLDNAFAHVEEPTIDVEIAPADHDPGAWVDVAIRDDGPGIPDRERAVVGGDREITQLDHSRGLGLWVTRWIVEGVGGQLVFGDQADGGSVVLRLRRADDGEATDR
jgi:PAS domain S-box-containing protein